MTATTIKKQIPSNDSTNRNNEQEENNAPLPSFVTQVSRTPVNNGRPPTDTPIAGGNPTLLPLVKPSRQQSDEDSEEVPSLDLNAIQVSVATPTSPVTSINKQGISSNTPSSPKKNKLLNYLIKSISWCFTTNGQGGVNGAQAVPVSPDKKDNEEIETVEENTVISMTTKKVVRSKRTSKNGSKESEDEDDEIEEEQTWSSTKLTTKKKKTTAGNGATTPSNRQPTPTSTTPSNRPPSTNTGKANIKYILPEQSERNAGKKCLVLDLDETLVHSCFQPIPNPDFVIPIEIEGTKHMVYVLKRPFVDDFMLEMSKVFEIVIFTASLSKYANPLLDQLDKHNVISARLFREHCTFIDNCYIKDLSRLGRDITQSLIIDNSPTCYALQPQNAMAVSSWFDDKKDTQLQQMIPWLVKMKEEKDVYETLQEYRVYYSQNGWNGNQQW